MTVGRRVIVSGRVQGVFFRASCRRPAERAGVSGWARNRADGAVEAVFEGDEEAVGRLVAWCRSGPPSARVDEVTVVDEPPSGAVSFEVR
jgi:acylphosphatase